MSVFSAALYCFFIDGRKKKIYVEEVNEQNSVSSVLVNIWLQLILTWLLMQITSLVALWTILNEDAWTKMAVMSKGNQTCDVDAR